jgi:hypothetical protein
MNDKTRTLIHVAVAAVVALVVGLELARTRDTGDDVTGPLTTALYPDFKDPLAAKSLEIIRFDEKLGKLTPFKVADVRGRWAIPSRDNYPADAQDRLRDASASLIDLKPIDVVTQLPEEHATLGVIEPVQGKTKAGDEGVGTLVVVQNAKGDDLFRLIVGKAASSEGENLPGLHFVRKPLEDIVYVAKIDMEKLPTDFDQWIEKDLLKLNALDVSKITLKDYNVLPSSAGRYSPFPRMDAVVSWNNEKGEWNLDELTRFSQNKPVPDGLGPQEELNKTKLDEMKTALDDLKIVDVKRKPAGIDAELKLSQELMNNREGLLSLQELGFYPVGRKSDDNTLELASANGEVIVDMKDGVQYKLRFGNVDSESTITGDKMNRYLFVSAMVNPSLLTPPKLEAEPAGPAPAPPAAKPDEEKKAGGGGADEGSSCQEEPKKEDGKTEAGKQETPPATEVAPPGPPPVVDPNQAALERVRKENRRRMEDWEERKNKATSRVAELNLRFSDWYYVISEDVYKKIHLSRADIVKEGTGAKDEGYGIDAFRKLETDGIKQLQPSTPPGGPGGGFPGGGFPGGFNP